MQKENLILNKIQKNYLQPIKYKRITNITYKLFKIFIMEDIKDHKTPHIK